MDVTVWMDNWQFDCCGEPFSIGSEVSWTIGPANSDLLADMLGTDTGVAIDAFEDHHSTGLGEGTPPTRGTVVALKGAYCRFACRNGNDPTRYLVGESGILVPLTRAKRFQEGRGELEFMGYVITLAVPDE